MAKKKLDEVSQTSFLINNFSKIAAIAIGFIAIGTVFYHIVEKWSWLDSVYFCVVTLATVGYGDFVPTTPLGKLFTIFYIIVGISIFVALARAIVLQIVKKRVTKKGKGKWKT